MFCDNSFQEKTGEKMSFARSGGCSDYVKFCHAVAG